MESEKIVIQKLQAYLDHKDADFKADSNRRDDAKRQKREQPRIQAVIDVLEEMRTEHDSLEYKFINSVINKERAKLQEKLQEEENIRNAQDISLEQYINSVYRSIDMIKNLNGTNWTPGKDETLEAFSKRVMEYNKADRYKNVNYRLIKDSAYTGNL